MRLRRNWENGLRAETTFEPVIGTKMFRFYVVSDGFAQMMHSERQSIVWRIVEKRQSSRCPENQHDLNADSRRARRVPVCCQRWLMHNCAEFPVNGAFPHRVPAR